MCGIALICVAGENYPLQASIERMVHTLLHRGPDGSGTSLHGQVALGHTRLAIVDIKGGQQPLITADARYAIVFNGEIYNYQSLRELLENQGSQFCTSSDTEVIVELYRHFGTDCVHRLRGMFAFVIHDRQSGRVFAARDRVGIKPLVYHRQGNTLVAASEIKALFASGLVEPEFDSSSIKAFFRYQFQVQPRTVFKDIYELPPGSFLTLDENGDFHIERYWDIRFPVDDHDNQFDEGEWLDRFSSALHDAAQVHTTGEVPIGAYLSGGVDSATTSWLLGEHYPETVHSFSIRFDNAAQDESEQARRISAHLGTQHTELLMQDQRPQGYVDDLVQALYFLEQPQRTAVDLPFFQLSERVRQEGYKVVYSGEGADEILAGYDCYRQDYMRLWGNDIQDAQLRWLLYFTQFTRDFPPAQIDHLYQLHEPSQQQSVIKRFGCYPVWYDIWHTLDDMTPGLFTAGFHSGAGENDPLESQLEAMKKKLDGVSRINQSLYIELHTRLPGWILWRSDRMSMAHGVEARVPFLDHELVELAASMPPELKLYGMNEKYILKKIAFPHLPEHPQHYQKRAFYTPVREWFFTAEYDDLLQPFLGEAAVRDAGIFEPAQVAEYRQQLLSLSQPQAADDHYRIMKLEWTLMLVLSIQILHQQFICKQADCFYTAS